MDELRAAFIGYLGERNRSVRTRDRYCRVLSSFTSYLRATRDDVKPAVDRITTDEVASFLRRRADGAELPAASTRNVELAVLRSFWKFLRRRGVSDRDPTAAVEFARLPRRDPTYLTLAEFDALVAAIKATASRSYRRRDVAIVTTAFHTGLRISELLSLDLDHVDWEELTFLGVVVKGGHEVDVAFNEEVAQAIDRYLPDRLRLLPGGNQTEHALFVSDRARRLSVRAVQVAFKRYLVAAGITKDATPHSLRHSTATHLLAAGEDLVVVADQLNHANLNTTRGYVHLAEDARHKAVAKLAVRVRAERKARRELARRAEVKEVGG